MLHGEPCAGDVVGVHAGEGSALAAVGDADDVAVPLGEGVEGAVAGIQVSDHDDAVGVGPLEHRAVGHRHVGTVVDVAEEQAEVALAHHLVDSA